MTPRHGPSARLPAVLSAITARVSGVCPGRGPRELSVGVTRRPGWCRRLSGHLALVAQRIDHLTTDQKVGGSSPSERAQVSGHMRGCPGSKLASYSSKVQQQARLGAFRAWPALAAEQ